VCLFTFTFVLDKVDESVFKSATHSTGHVCHSGLGGKNAGQTLQRYF